MNMEKITLVRNTLEQLNKFYPPGLYEWLYANNKSKYYRLMAIELEIDNILIEGTIKDMKDVLNKYWKFHKDYIEKFNKKGQLNLDLPKVREKRLEERTSA